MHGEGTRYVINTGTWLERLEHVRSGSVTRPVLRVRRRRDLERDVPGAHHERGTGVEVDVEERAADVFERVANRSRRLAREDGAVVLDSSDGAAPFSFWRS